MSAAVNNVTVESHRPTTFGQISCGVLFRCPSRTTDGHVCQKVAVPKEIESSTLPYVGVLLMSGQSYVIQDSCVIDPLHKSAVVTITSLVS